MSESIEFECPYCQKRTTVPAHYAGKRGQCPGCKQAIEVPDPNAVDEEVSDDSDSGEVPAGDTKPCPMCGETIKKVAKKCKHCKSVLDKRLERSRATQFANEAKGKAETPPSAMDWVLVVLCPGIACIIGIVAMIQGYTKRGSTMVGVSLLWGILSNVIRVALMQGSHRY